MQKLSFVIPCYGSEHTISQVVGDIQHTVESNKDYMYEIILVNDNSPDGVFEVIKDLCSKHKNIIGIDLAKNFGQHSAILTGFRYATGDIIIGLDDDGQTPPDEVFNLIDKLDEGYDVVIAKYPDKKHSLFRNAGSRLNDLMTRWLLGKPKDLSLMSYFCCKQFVAKEIIKYNNPYPHIQGLLLRSTLKITNVDIHHRKRKEGQSGYKIGKLIALWVNGFTAFSVKPLRLATILGIIFSFVGFIYGIYVLLNKLLNPITPMGYSSLMAVMVFMCGMILLLLGLMGEYVGRVYISINNSPQAVIREVINKEQ